MKLRLKILLLTLVPMTFALGSIIMTVSHQSLELARQQRHLVESALLSSKDAELRAYVKLAQTALKPHISNDGDPSHRKDAIAMLARMDFGTDGYFFLYDLEGRNLMHPRQPELVGENLWELRDPYGNSPIQSLIGAAKQGGGIVKYYWNKPSVKQTAQKLGYVEPIWEYGWMLGTGLYLDDIESNLKDIDAKARANIQETLVLVFAISVACVLLVGGSGVALNISDHREASLKLRQLAQKVVSSQEDERARVARELHDGISQVLVSAKLLVETASATLAADESPGHKPAATLAGREDARPEDKPSSRQRVAATLGRALDRLNQALIEVRRISHGLRPSVLDDLGLAAALRATVSEFRDDSGLDATFETVGQPIELPLKASTALFRICQEALTNARVHSCASAARVLLRYEKRRVVLGILDNGDGFDVNRVQVDRTGGVGLRNMRERANAVGGRLSVRSDSNGTEVTATLPTSALAAA